MSKFKIGDIVKETKYEITPYKYGIIRRINGIEIWCFWATSLINLNQKNYSCDGELWANEEGLIKIGEENRNVKVYGIVFFCSSLNKEK
jgi:hypothetical protein